MEGLGAYSRFVALAKVLLPLTALVLLALVFLLARPPSETGENIPYARLDELAKDPRITAPRFSGVAGNGTVVTVSAQAARPGADTLSAEQLSARLVPAQGGWVTIDAGVAELNTAARTARIKALARVETSTGYRIETTGVEANLSTARLESTGPIEAHAPFGEITARKLIIETLPEIGQQIRFHDQVRLIYTPQPIGEPQ